MKDERDGIDPEGRYPADGRRTVERNAERVLSLLPNGILSRTRDAIQVDFADDRGITVIITAEAFEFRLPTVEWTCGAYGPARSSRLWKRVRADALTDDRLEKMLQEALARRASQFRKCRYCKREVPPEHRHSRDVCHTCAERHLGVVH